MSSVRSRGALVCDQGVSSPCPRAHCADCLSLVHSWRHTTDKYRTGVLARDRGALVHDQGVAIPVSDHAVLTVSPPCTAGGRRERGGRLAHGAGARQRERAAPHRAGALQPLRSADGGQERRGRGPTGHADLPHQQG